MHIHSLSVSLALDDQRVCMHESRRRSTRDRVIVKVASLMKLDKKLDKGGDIGEETHDRLEKICVRSIVEQMNRHRSTEIKSRPILVVPTMG